MSEKKILNETKNHKNIKKTLQVKWSVPKCHRKNMEYISMNIYQVSNCLNQSATSIIKERNISRCGFLSSSPVTL